MFPALSASRSAPTLTPAEQWRSRKIGEELKSSTIARGEFKGSTGAGVVPHARWIGGSADEQASASMIRALDMKRRRDYDGAELDAVFESFALEREMRAHVLDDKRWELLAVLARELESHHGVHFKLGGANNALYERMFRAQPSKYMSQAQFFAVMQRAAGFEVANPHGLGDVRAANILSSLFNAFDEKQKDQMDWRAFLLMLRTLASPMNPPRDHLLWGFALYSSAGSLDLSCADPVQLLDLKDMFSATAHYHTRAALLDRLNAAWVAVADSDREAAALAQKAEKKGMPLNSVMLPLRCFERMLSQPQVAILFDAERPYGKMDPQTWTYHLEERYYHPSLLHAVKVQRRRRRNELKVEAFLEERFQRVKRRRCSAWVNYVIRRKRCRYLMARNIVRYHLDNLLSAMVQWRAFALTEIRAIEAQRVARGFLGRAEGQFLRLLHGSALRMQSKYRGRLARRRYQEKLARMQWAATELQRHIRGNAARLLALYRLEDRYDKVKRKLDKDRWEFENATLLNAVVRIQGVWRARDAKAAVGKKREERDALNSLDEEYRGQELELERSKRIYREQLVEWYKKEKDSMVNNRVFEEQSAKERDKIMKYRRQNKDKDKEQYEAMKLRQAEFLEEQRVEKWIEDWKQKQEDRALKYRAYLEQCLTNPVNGEERAIRKKLRREIEKRTKNVLKRAEKKKVPMEKPEAYDMAQNEILLAYMDEERERVVQEQRAAAEQHYALKAEEAEAKRLEALAGAERAKTYSARAIQRVYRCFLSRKELRKLCYKAYTKGFNAEHAAFYYQEKRTGEIRWTKPVVLGLYDIQVKNEWVVMRDVHQDHYYFNPHSLNMMWETPKKTTICSKCDTEFATRRCNILSACYCEKCYVAVQSDTPDPPILSWKPFDGGVPGSDKTSWAVIKDMQAPRFTITGLTEHKQYHAEKVKARPSLLKKSAKMIGLMHRVASAAKSAIVEEDYDFDDDVGETAVAKKESKEKEEQKEAFIEKDHPLAEPIIKEIEEGKPPRPVLLAKSPKRGKARPGSRSRTRMRPQV